MTLTSTNDPISIFELKPGIYKIQNIIGQTYVDIQEYTRELCGRPAAALEEKGLVGFCPYFAHIVAAPIVSSGKFSPPVLDIPYAGCGVEIRSASIAVY